MPLRKPEEKSSVVIKDTSGKFAQQLLFQKALTGHKMKNKLLYVLPNSTGNGIAC